MCSSLSHCSRPQGHRPGRRETGAQGRRPGKHQAAGPLCRQATGRGHRGTDPTGLTSKTNVYSSCLCVTTTCKYAYNRMSSPHQRDRKVKVKGDRRGGKGFAATFAKGWKGKGKGNGKGWKGGKGGKRGIHSKEDNEVVILPQGRSTGVVISFQKQRGFGFVKLDQGEQGTSTQHLEVFVHATGLRHKQGKLRRNQKASWACTAAGRPIYDMECFPMIPWHKHGMRPNTALAQTHDRALSGELRSPPVHRQCWCVPLGTFDG